MSNAQKAVSRREFLQTSAGAMGAAFLQAGPPNGTVTRVAVFIPGTMGSVLRNRAGDVVWSQDVFQVYRTLIYGTNLLDFPSVQLEAVEVLDQAYVQEPTLGRYQLKSFYRRFISLLSQHPDFRRPGGLFLFPYDWRQDVRETVRQLRGKLEKDYGVVHDARGIAQRHPSYQFDVIGHSQGGLVALLAVSRQVIHPDNIGRLILVGTPLLGAPASFSNLYDRSSFPGLEGANLIWWRKNRDRARERLRTIAQSFVSLYQLLPPEPEQYINDLASGAWTNPLNGRVIQPPKTRAATNLHGEIEAALSAFPIDDARVHVVYADDDLNTDAAYWVRQVSSGMTQRYEISTKGPSRGDGTVLSRSSRDAALRISSAPKQVLAVEHSEMCDDRQVLDIVRSLLW